METTKENDNQSKCKILLLSPNGDICEKKILQSKAQGSLRKRGRKIVRARGLGSCDESGSPTSVRSYTHRVRPTWKRFLMKYTWTLGDPHGNKGNHTLMVSHVQIKNLNKPKSQNLETARKKKTGKTFSRQYPQKRYLDVIHEHKKWEHNWEVGYIKRKCYCNTIARVIRVKRNTGMG